jgi:DNA uptake protein ComE-like DNA-binding protein
VRLDARTIGRLAKIGRAKGIGPSTLERIRDLITLD